MIECAMPSSRAAKVVSIAERISFAPGSVLADISAEMVPGTKLVISNEYEFRGEIRNVEHHLVDIRSLHPYRGTIMIKADGMKVYAFCHPNGYVITSANQLDL